MKLVYLRFTLLRMMIATAALAVAWSMFVGFRHLAVYRTNVKAERYYRKGAMLGARRAPVPAADWQGEAEDMARSNRESLDHVSTLLFLIGLGAVLGLAGSLLKNRIESQDSKVRVMVRSACVTGAVIVCGGFIICISIYILIIIYLMFSHSTYD